MGIFERLRRAAERVTGAVADAATAVLDAAAEALGVSDEPKPRRAPPSSKRKQKDATRSVAPAPKPKPQPKPKPKLKPKRKAKRKGKPYQRVPAGETYYYKGKEYKAGRFAPMRAKPRRAPVPGSRVPAGQTLRLTSGKVLRGGQFIPKSAREVARRMVDAESPLVVGSTLFGGAWEVTTPKQATHWVGILTWIDPETGKPAYMQTRIGLNKANVTAEAQAMTAQRKENGASKEVQGPSSVSIVPIRRVREVFRTKVAG